MFHGAVDPSATTLPGIAFDCTEFLSIPKLFLITLSRDICFSSVRALLAFITFCSSILLSVNDRLGLVGEVGDWRVSMFKGDKVAAARGSGTSIGLLHLGRLHDQWVTLIKRATRS